MKIVVYCSSRERLDNKYQQLARQLGTWIGNNGHTLVYGGSNAGLMHITSTTVHETGGRVVGVIPEIFKHRIDPICYEVIHTPDLSARKQYMIENGDIFIVLPGGIGTLDEWISTLTVMCIDRKSSRPIIVANIDGLFDSAINQLAGIVGTPFARNQPICQSIIVQDVTKLLQTLETLTSDKRS